MAEKENEFVKEFERENLDVSNCRNKKKASGKMETEGGHLLIFKRVSGDSRAEDRVERTVNKKHSRPVNK